METRSPAERALRFSELSLPRQRLVRICQMLNYGSIRRLEIKHGEPVFEPPPLLAVDLKLDRVGQARTEVELQDFLLRDELLRLMHHFDHLPNTTVELLEVYVGIPRRVVFISPLDSWPAFLVLGTGRQR
jgi:hypothetical protein